MVKKRTVQVLLTEGDRPARILMEKEIPTAGQIGVAVRAGEDVSNMLDAKEFDVMLLDKDLEGADGDQPLRMLRGSGQETDVLVISDNEEDEEIGSERGDDEVYDFLTRPMSPSEIRRLLSGNPGKGRTTPRGRPTIRPSGIVGASEKLQELLDRIHRVAKSSASVLVYGETGTGKTLVARALHQNSGRKDKPFVVVNCSAFQDQLLESELFGHEKGAFTGAVTAKPGLFEVADGGTLFLDEVAEMSSAMQAKLLQVLDSGDLRRVGGTRLRKVDARIVAATNKDLAKEVKDGNFREDLLFRLNVVTLVVPPLRERKDDVPELVEHFLHRFAPNKSLSPAALRLLTEYRWPGNIRELANTLEGLALLAPGEIIEPQDLPPSIRPATNFELEQAEAPLPMTEIERIHIGRALRYTEGKKAPAARLLGIDVKTLNNKIKNYGIEL